jgi:CheY-like chemotaxis protein
MGASLLKEKEILIIDDDPDIRILVRKILESEGGRVYEAEDVPTGFDLALQKVPHLVLTDLNIPNLSGFNLVEKFKTNEKLRDIPIVVLSARNDFESVNRVVALGARDYIIKPFKADSLLQKVHKSLQIKVFKRHVFTVGERPKLQIAVAVDVIMANETGLVMNCPVKLAPVSDVKLDDKFLNSIECQGIQTRTTAVGRANGRNCYLSELNLIGVSRKGARKIASLVKKEK